MNTLSLFLPSSTFGGIWNHTHSCQCLVWNNYNVPFQWTLLQKKKMNLFRTGVRGRILLVVTKLVSSYFKKSTYFKKSKCAYCRLICTVAGLICSAWQKQTNPHLKIKYPKKIGIHKETRLPIASLKRKLFPFRWLHY